jgi:hypothetical protein
MLHSWFHWLHCGCARQRAPRACWLCGMLSRPLPPLPWHAIRTGPRKHGTRSMLQLLALEDRTVLSVLTVLNNADSGAGSLRDTLTAAQSGDTIVFDPGLEYQTITLSSGPLALSNNLTIDGPGANLLAISGNHASQLFALSGSAQITLANLTLTEGASSQGGAIFIGGGAALTLDSDLLSDNQAVGDSNGTALGGAVYTSAGASLTVDNTLFVDNQSNGAQVSFGGAIANAGTLSIQAATFTGNAALGSTTEADNPPGGSQGGAIGNLDGATFTIALSTFTGNQALGNGGGDGQGGAICNELAFLFPFTGIGVTSTVSQCTFDNNLAQGGSNAINGGYAGAIENNPGSDLAVLKCLFTGNRAVSGGDVNAVGGAIRNAVAAAATISDSEFISNSAIGSKGAIAAGGAVFNAQTVTVANSLFIGNSAVGGPKADGIQAFGEGLGGAICTGNGINNRVTVVLTISNSVIAGNAAVGGSEGSTLAYNRTDAADGGGIANLNGGTLNVDSCTITGNHAVGGASSSGKGGAAFGGGIENNHQCTLNLTNSTVSTNLTQGGAGARGAGAGGGIAAGGGIGNDFGAIAIITNSTLSYNDSLGGTGGAGANGGDGVGAGISNGVFAFAFGVHDASSLIVSNCQIVGNQAQGGTANSSAVGGDGLGGGLFVGSGSAMLEAVLVSSNQAQGGVDSQGNTTGQGLGGGVYVDPSASATMDMQTLIAGNQASMSNNDVWGTITVGP